VTHPKGPEKGDLLQTSQILKMIQLQELGVSAAANLKLGWIQFEKNS
jgi:hypothetical protein